MESCWQGLGYLRLIMEFAPIRKSLLRRITWFGGDRRIVGMSGLVLFMLGYTVFIGFGPLAGLPYIAIILALFFALLWLARAFNNADPWMVDIYLRHVQRYKKYYAPQSSLNVEHPVVRDF